MEVYKGYVGAPYNFVGLNDKVYRRKPVPHNDSGEGRKSGTIRYEIEAVTPIFVGDGAKDQQRFFRDCCGRSAIPGSTVRGLVRSNIQILSASSIRDDIRNGHLMYRSVAGGFEQKNYNHVLGSKAVPVGQGKNISVLCNVKAGYIRNEGGKYKILRTKVDHVGKSMGEMNYYVVSEHIIIQGRYKNFEYLRDEGILQHLNGRFEEYTDRRGKKHYKGKSNPAYRPYIRKISYSLKDSRHVYGIGKPGRYSLEGYILSSGRMNEKKAFYVIPEIDESKEAIPVSAEAINDFKRDYEGRKKQVEAMDKSFFKLPGEGETKPVFYIRLGERLYFGFTPRLRLFYDKEIYDGLPRAHREDTIDYSKSLFGYSSDAGSYRSRLSFKDAVMEQGRWGEQKRQMILGEPKPTSYLDYLEPAPKNKKEVVSYNDDFRLRGIKQYWMRDMAESDMTGKNQRVVSTMYPYGAGARFHGEIRFTNLSEEELGMLLWGLLLEEGSNQNIGKGKPYGYGRIIVRMTALKIEDRDTMYGTESFCLEPYADETEHAAEYISAAKKEMSDFLGRDVMKDPKVRDFLAMKDPSQLPPADRVRYMSLDNREYQNRNNDWVKLPSVSDVIKGTPPKKGR